MSSRSLNGINPLQDFSLGEWQLQELPDGMVGVFYQGQERFRAISQPNVNTIARCSNWAVRKDPRFNFSIEPKG